MKEQAPEIIRETDILGLEKPKNQLKRLRKSGGWLLTVVLVILAIIALVVFFLMR